MKRVLITGVTGYIGSNLAKTLAINCEVYGLARKPLNSAYLTPGLQKEIKLFYFDGTYDSVVTAINESRPDIVYHLAAYYVPNHEIAEMPALLEGNIVLGAYLLEAMSMAHCKRLVFTTTPTTHYSGKEYRPLSFYAAAKRAYSDIIEFYADIKAFETVEIVLPDTYGPGDKRKKILNLIREASRKKAPMALTSGKQIYDVVYIDDIIKGLIQAGELILNPAAMHHFYQLTSSEYHSLRETVELMLRINNSEYQPDWGALPDPKGIAVPVRIYPVLPGWEPKVPLGDGLKKMWNHIENSSVK
ncbi:NAD(P)-dependent oxidoreductase [Oscillospiraceae bacterium 42-9]